jgi:hypothetical protein
VRSPQTDDELIEIALKDLRAAAAADRPRHERNVEGERKATASSVTAKQVHVAPAHNDDMCVFRPIAAGGALTA